MDWVYYGGMSILENNLKAMEAEFARSAERIAAASIPDGFVLYAGTDGTETYSRKHIDSNGKTWVEWLGGTSMPAASAEAIIKSLDAYSNGQNGLGLSMGTGFEWAAFCRRLGRAQMVYVYERDLEQLRMALSVCDLSGVLAERRLVILAGTPEEAAADLSGFLSQHLGFEPPAVMHPLPTLVDERRNQFLAAGEAIVRRVVVERQGRIGGLLESAPVDRPSGGSNSSPSILALLLTPRYRWERPIQWEVQRKGAEAIYLDHYASTSSAFRLEKLKMLRDRGPVRVISDLFREQLALMPADVAVETWVPPLIGAAFWERVPAASSFGPNDRLVVHSAHHAEMLAARGIGRQQIEIREMAIPPMESVGTTAGGEATRVAMIADLASTDMATLGIQLPTHQSVFMAARELILADYLTVHPGLAGDLLRRALSRAGVDSRVEDPALKEPMLRIIRDVLIPALPLLRLAAELAREGIPLSLIGDWPNLEIVPPADVEVFAFENVTPATWSRVALLVHESPGGTFSPYLFEAMATGVPVMRVPPASTLTAGTFPEWLVAEKDFAQAAPHQFIGTVKALLRDPSRRTKLSEAALKAYERRK